MLWGGLESYPPETSLKWLADLTKNSLRESDAWVVFRIRTLCCPFTIQCHLYWTGSVCALRLDIPQNILLRPIHAHTTGYTAICCSLVGWMAHCGTVRTRFPIDSSAKETGDMRWICDAVETVRGSAKSLCIMNHIMGIYSSVKNDTESHWHNISVFCGSWLNPSYWAY